MRPLRLQLDNFLTYRSLDLDLGDARLVGVVGVNGSGKSSLLDAVLWALFGTGRYTTDGMMRRGEQRMVVTYTFLVGGRTVSVRRERSLHTKAGESTLTLIVDGENRTGHTIAETQQQIQRLIGLTLDALLAGPIMVQAGTPALERELTRVKPAMRKDLLIDMANLGYIEAWHARAAEWQGQASVELSVLEREVPPLDEVIGREVEVAKRLADSRSALDVEEQRTTDTGERIMALREEGAKLLAEANRANELTASMAEAQRQIEARTRSRDALIEQQSRYRQFLATTAEVPPANDVAGLDERIAHAEEAATDKRHRQRLYQEKRTEYAQARRASEILDTVPCQHLPVDLLVFVPAQRAVVAEACRACQFLVDAAAARERMADLEATGRELKIEDETVANAEGYVATLRRGRDESARQATAYELDSGKRSQATMFVEQVDGQVAEHNGDLERLSAAITGWQAERLRLMQANERRSQISDELGKVAIEHEDAKAQVRRLTMQLADHQATLRAIATAKKRRAELEAAIPKLRDRFESLSLLSRALHRDGVPTLILENMLPQIERRANEILDRLPEGWTIELRTQRLNKSGSVREQLDVILYADGAATEYELLSGGEKFRVDFALRIALNSVLAKRAGTTVDMLWLDEGWGSQDREGRKALLEAIAAVRDDFRFIAVVSHVREVTDPMPQRLIVEKRDGASTAVLV